MPAHRLHGATSATPARSKKRPVRKARPHRPPTPASPAPPSPQRPAVVSDSPNFAASHQDDLYVDITVGDYSTSMSVATLKRHPSALLDAYAHDLACNLRTPEGRIALHLTGDGNSFRSVETFMNTGTLPPSLQRDQLDYLRRSTTPLMMPQLELELREFYPLREAIRRRSSTAVQQPCAYIIDVLMYAAALVKFNGAPALVSHCLSTLPTTNHSPDDQTLAHKALAENEIRRSGLLFAYIMLRRMSETKRLAYFTTLVGRSATTFYIHGDLGEQLVRAGLIDLSALFLQKSRRIIPETSLSYQAQHLRTVFFCSNQVSADIIASLRTIQLEQEDCVTSSALGQALTLHQNWHEATQVLRKSLNQNLPEELKAGAHFALGTCYHAQHQMDNALVHYELAHKNAPYDSSTCAALGTALYDLLRFSEAYQWRNLMTVLEPASADAHLSLGDTLAAQGLFDKALQSYETASSIDPSNIIIFKNKVFAAERMGNWQQAIIDQRKVIALGFDDADHWRELANFYIADNQPIAAHGATQHSLRLQERNNEASQATNLLLTLAAAEPATPEAAEAAEAPTVVGGPAEADGGLPLDGNDYLLFDLPDLETQSVGQIEDDAWLNLCLEY